MLPSDIISNPKNRYAEILMDKGGFTLICPDYMKRHIINNNFYLMRLGLNLPKYEGSPYIDRIYNMIKMMSSREIKGVLNGACNRGNYDTCLYISSMMKNGTHYNDEYSMTNRVNLILGYSIKNGNDELASHIFLNHPDKVNYTEVLIYTMVIHGVGIEYMDLVLNNIETENKSLCYNSLYTMSAACGSIEKMKNIRAILKKRKPCFVPSYDDMIMYAVNSGSVEMVKYVVRKATKLPQSDVLNVYGKCNIDIIRYISKISPNLIIKADMSDIDFILDKICKSSNIEVLDHIVKVYDLSEKVEDMIKYAIYACSYNIVDHVARTYGYITKKEHVSLAETIGCNGIAHYLSTSAWLH